MTERTLGLRAATGVGVGAIVGGGILALAGVAFETTGPSAILAFAINGGIALLTAASFAELAVRFPQSGGTYTYARKVLTVEAAFAVGWVVWFASVVAAVLYAMGFAVFFVPFMEIPFLVGGGEAPEWIGGRFALIAYALGAIGFYVWSLTRSAAGGGQWATVGKVVVFAVLILGGLWALFTVGPPPGGVGAAFSPFFENGGTGLAQAMGYTFIALQGFDLIAAVGGEVKDPKRNIPRAMFLSLGAALGIYLPLLFLIVVVGSGGTAIAALAADDPEILVAVAARNFLGSVGYWLVITAGVLSMLSALQANLLAASRFARTMALDRTLPRRLGELSGTGSPVEAVQLTAIMVAFVLIAIPDLAAAGAVSSLIFLASFSLTHMIGYLARKRTGAPDGFASPWFPAVPIAGGGACLVIGLYQALAVPSAGVLAALWLSVGAVLFALYLAPRARVVDASSEGADPQMMKLRGRQPVVLVPIANPASAHTLVTMARALAPPAYSRVQLLSVVGLPGDQEAREVPWSRSRRVDDNIPWQVRDAQRILGGALLAALSADLRPEALITIHEDPWREIARLANASACESLLLGLGTLNEEVMTGPVEWLIDKVDAEVVILRAPSDWKPDEASKILIPARGGRMQSPVRARLLGSLGRTATRDVTYLSIMREDTTADISQRSLRDLQRMAQDEVVGAAHAEVVLSSDPVAKVVERAADTDVLILGLHRRGRQRGIFGDLMLEIVRRTTCPLLIIGQRK